MQSFDDAALRRLGRIHDAATARAAVAEALAAGFASVNLDLMYALPGQGVAGALADVRRALECGVPHVSHYELTLEPETPLGRAPPADLPGEEAILAMEAACRAELEAAGLQRYEVSAYARAGHRCAHNLGYWRFADFLGLGAGAHGKYTTPAGEVVRTARRAAARRWMAEAGSAAALARCAALGRGEVAVEFLLNALRLTEGFTPALAEARTGWSWPALAAALAPARRRGLLEWHGGRVRASAAGLALLDSALVEIAAEIDRLTAHGGEA